LDLAADYNNRALVPGHPAIIARWQAESEAYRAEHSCELDISYGAKPRNRLDLFPGVAVSPHQPMVVFIHGGYWKSLDKRIFSHIARGPNRHGLDVAIVGYSLCPEVTICDIIAEMRQCCLFLWGCYRRKLLVTGHSAGGHLAACLAATQWEDYGQPPDLVQAGLSISGLFDLRPLIATPLNDDLGLSPAEALAASPLAWPVKGRHEFDSWVGGAESIEFRRQARSIAAAWRGIGWEAHYFEVVGANHFTVADALSDPDHPMTMRVRQLAGIS
jgi:arylformamidase